MRARLIEELLAPLTSKLDRRARTLLIDDPSGALTARFLAQGFERLEGWTRWSCGARAGHAWPDHLAPGSCAAAVMRLPQGKDVLKMNLHAAASRLEAGGELWLVGANDEGIKSASRHLAELCGQARVLAARRHGRVLATKRPERLEVRGELESWALEIAPPLPEQQGSWRHYPGLFAKGRLDDATAMLIDALAQRDALRGAQSALDFASGGGVLSAWMLKQRPALKVTLLDADALAIEASRANVPGARAHLCSDGWQGVPEGERFDLIVSNPPIHRGKEEDFGVLRALLEDAAPRLLPSAQLWFVVQRQVPVEAILRESKAWRAHELIAQDTRFRVWRALAS